MTCAIEGCKGNATKRGWCGKHYWRWRKHGDPTAGRTENGRNAEFLASLLPAETCIDWPFAKNGNGYGSKVKGQFPHRIVCETFHGPAPSDKHEVAHSCGRRPCVNPSHLRWALHIENEQDKLLHGTHRSQLVARGKNER